MRNHELGTIKSQERNKGEDEKLTRTRENGGCGNGRTGTKGTTEMDTVGIAETSAMGVVGVAVEGIPTFAATPGPSKVSTKYENRHTNKGRLQQRGDANTYV